MGFADLCRRLDRLVSTDLGGRGIEPLAEAAAAAMGGSMIARAVSILREIPAGATVVFTTGSVTRPWVSPALAESDGPGGTAALIRALSVGRRIRAVVVGEESLAEPICHVLRQAGITPTTRQGLQNAVDRHSWGPTLAAAYETFPLDRDEADRAAQAILASLRPAALVAIERAGENDRGIYHNMRGYDYSQGRARVDSLFRLARERGVPVVAVGDGGNEIGMGTVREAVARHVPFGAKCQCGCGGGLVAATQADALVVAATSNWGCYGLVAALAAAWRLPEILHTPEREDLMLRQLTASSLIDGKTGRAEASVDGLPRAVNLSMVELIAFLGRAAAGVPPAAP